MNQKIYTWENNDWKLIEPDIVINSLNVFTDFKEEVDNEFEYIPRKHEAFNGILFETMNPLNDIFAVMTQDQTDSITTMLERNNLFTTPFQKFISIVSIIVVIALCAVAIRFCIWVYRCIAPLIKCLNTPVVEAQRIPITPQSMPYVTPVTDEHLTLYAPPYVRRVNRESNKNLTPQIENFRQAHRRIRSLSGPNNPVRFVQNP